MEQSRRLIPNKPTLQTWASEVDAPVAGGPAHAPGRPRLPVDAPAPRPRAHPLVLVHHLPHPPLEPAPRDAPFLGKHLRVALPVRVQRRRAAPAVVDAVPGHQRRQLAAGVRHREHVRRGARDEVQGRKLQWRNSCCTDSTRCWAARTELIVGVGSSLPVKRNS